MLMGFITDVVPGQPMIRALLFVEQSGENDNVSPTLIMSMLNIIEAAKTFGGNVTYFPPSNVALIIPSQKLPAVQTVIKFPSVTDGVKFQKTLRTLLSTPPLL